MKKLNRAIGGGAVALAVTLMAGVMERGMVQARMANMLPTKEMKVSNLPMTSMKIMVNKEMGSKMKMG